MSYISVVNKANYKLLSIRVIETFTGQNKMDSISRPLIYLNLPYPSVRYVCPNFWTV